MMATKSTPTFVIRTIITKHLNTPSPDSSQFMTILTSAMTKMRATSNFLHGLAISA